MPPRPLSPSPPSRLTSDPCTSQRPSPLPAVSRRTARDFDTRPGLKYLLMKVSGVCGAANLYRQSAMSFNLYFQALLSAALSQAEGATAQQVPQLVS